MAMAVVDGNLTVIDGNLRQFLRPFGRLGCGRELVCLDQFGLVAGSLRLGGAGAGFRVAGNSALPEPPGRLEAGEMFAVV